MDEQTLNEQAARIEQLLPRLMRRLFPSGVGHPIGELSLAQLRVCSLLQSGPRSVSALGEELGISASAVTQLADRLEHAGMVERECGEEDRRMRVLKLTPQGASMMERRRDRRVRRVRCVIEGLTDELRAGALISIEALVREAEARAPEADDLDCAAEEYRRPA